MGVSVEGHCRPSKRSRLATLDAVKPRLGLRWQSIQRGRPLCKSEVVPRNYGAFPPTDAGAPRAFRRRLRSGMIDLTTAVDDDDADRLHSCSTTSHLGIVPETGRPTTCISSCSVAGP